MLARLPDLRRRAPNVAKRTRGATLSRWQPARMTLPRPSKLLMSTRAVLCIDLDAFFASVEELLHPEWRGQPIVVGGRPDERGVVSSCTYAARKFGVRSAMPMSRALQLCPQAIRATAHFELYREYSQRVMRIVDEYGCPVEQVSVDAVLVEATECVLAWGSARALAAAVKRRIHDEVGLSCTIDIATSK